MAFLLIYRVKYPNKMNRVLSFDNYHKLFEAEDANGAVSAAEQIVNLFYQAYGNAVTKIGDYKDAIDDLLSVAEEKDAAKKADLFETVLKKVVAFSMFGNFIASLCSDRANRVNVRKASRSAV